LPAAGTSSGRTQAVTSQMTASTSSIWR
jgi:hypothetical protein